MKICSVCERCFEEGVGFCSDPTHGELGNGPHSVDIVSGYRIERVLVSSPKAVSYQAQHREYGQSCVISIADADGPRFLSDAKILAGLFHSSVAVAIESGELSNGSAYAVFEGSDGTSLRNVLEGGTLSLLDQIRIARQAAEGVHAMHSAGLLHGALRPENVSITRVGSEELSVKVHNIDLGSAFANGILSNPFSMHSSLVSLRYFAPERFRGESPTVQSDVYSLGVVLYELLSGHPPFEAQSAAALADMHLNQKPPEIKIENFDLRMLLTHTMNESLQKQPPFRQSTADLFARQMRHIEQLATHVSTPPPAVALAMAASPADRSIATRPVPRRIEDVSVSPIAEVTPAYVPVPRDTNADRIVSKAVVKSEQTPVGNPGRVQAPMPFVPTPKRSRLKSMKKRVHSYVSDGKAALDPGPTLIDWKTPNVDVPSTARGGEDLKAPMTPTPKLIDWQQPEDDVPSIDAVREELGSSGATVTFEAEEETTEVQMPAKRIEVKWSEPVAERPSLITSESIPNTMPSLLAAASNAQFLGYQPRGRDLGKLPIYGIALFALVVVGFGVVRLGTALAQDSGGYIGEARPSRIEIPAAPMQPAAIEPQAAVLSIPAQAVIVPAPLETSVEEPLSGISKEEPRISKEKFVDTAAPYTSKPSRRSVSDEPRTATIKPSSSGSDPFVPSTLVITRAAGKPKTVVVAEPSARESRPAKVGSGATRPRIVSLPN